MHHSLQGRLCWSLVLLAALAACSSESKSGTDTSSTSGGTGGGGGSNLGCKLDFLGDPTKEPELELTIKAGNDPDDPVTPIVDGGTVPLIQPPQGGRVIFAGVRATNISPCALTLKGALRDPISQQVRIDGRTINLKPTGDGWGESNDTSIADFANVPLCPNQWSKQDVFDQPFELTVSLAAKDGTKVSKTVTVTPTCAQPDTDEFPYYSECRCTCKTGYVLGEVCDGAGGGGAGGGGTGGNGG